MSRLTESLQAELVGTGVRAVAIAPGFFATEIYTDDKRPRIDDTSVYASMVRRVDETIAAGISQGADPAIVAASIVANAHDPDTPTRVLVGDDAVAAYDEFRREQIAEWQTSAGAPHGGGGARVEALSVVADQDRSVGAFADGQVDGSGGAWHEWDPGGLVALTDDLQGAMTAFEPEVVDVRAARLADPQSVQTEQHGERGVHR